MQRTREVLRGLSTIAILLAGQPLGSAPGQPSEAYDVVIVGGTSAGVGAAIGAGRLGARVALIEETPLLGGMLVNGVSNIDSFSYESLSGAFEEFRLQVKAHYAPAMATDPLFQRARNVPRHIDGRSLAAHDPQEGGRWEPHVADRILKSMIRALPTVQVFHGRFATGVVMEGRRLAGVATDTAAGERRVLRGHTIIDATTEGDVAAWAGASYRVGREARSPVEPHAGEIYFANAAGEMMPGSTGRQDRAVVSYGLRLIVQNYPPGAGGGHLLETPPPGYEPRHYAQSAYTGRPDVPNGKAEMNVNPVGNELQEVNWSWPEASRAERRALYERYRNHALGFLYFLQHERGLKHLGLPRDEYVGNENVPYQVYVREARRVEGDVLLTEADINPFINGRGLLPAIRGDSVAIGHYPIDSKPVRRKTNLSTPDKGEGDFFLVNVATAYQIPYGAIVPRGIDGLLVPAALSATHVAYSAIRLDPTWMVIGQASGVAAALAAQQRVPARGVRLDDLQRSLLRQRCRLMFYWDLPLDHPAFRAVQWLSVRQNLRGYPDRLFRPDAPLSRAEMAVFLRAAFDAWPSVSDAHFEDVPYDHWAFRDIETLYDRQALGAFGIRPRWPALGPYDPARHAGFAQSRPRGVFQPGAAVRLGEFVESIRALADPAGAGRALTLADVKRWLEGSEFGRPVTAGLPAFEGVLTRGQAAALLAALLNRVGEADRLQEAGR